MNKNKINKISIYYFKKYARVYLEDTDAGGIVYHTSYLKFAERARSDMLRKMKLEHTQVRVNKINSFDFLFFFLIFFIFMLSTSYL